MRKDKPELKQDNVPTNEPCPNCRKPTQVHMNVRAGQGRSFCACGWSDKITSSSASPGVQVGGISDPQVRSSGVTIVGKNESSSGVTILGGN